MYHRSGVQNPENRVRPWLLTDHHQGLMSERSHASKNRRQHKLPHTERSEKKAHAGGTNLTMPLFNKFLVGNR